VNKKFWDGLPADIRNQLTQAMADATKVANEDALKDNMDALAKVKASGKSTVYEPSKGERFLLKKAMFPVHKQMSSRIGEETIKDIYKATNFDPTKM
jgi:C4-dicarboxylate-binding protein DctP